MVWDLSHTTDLVMGAIDATRDKTMKVKLLDIGKPTHDGSIYSLEEVEKAIQNPNFVSRIETGRLLCELGTPMKFSPDVPDTIDRFITIEVEQWCGKISLVWIEKDALMGEFEYVGPLKQVARDLGEIYPMTFTMRSLPRKEEPHCSILHIITFDLTPLGRIKTKSTGTEN